MVDFVRSEHEGGTHSAVARLHSRVDSYNDIAETFAVMDTHNIMLHQFRSGKKAKQFRLSPTEADAFVMAWAQYKADTQAAIEAEQERQAGVEMETRKIAADLGLEIETEEWGNDTRYTLKHPHRYINSSYVYTVDGLLKRVKEFQAQLEDEKQAIAEAKEVADKITSLCGDTVKITSKQPAYNGLYDLSIVGRFSTYSLCNVRASEILERLQPILNQLEQEAKAQQTSAIS